MVLQDTVLFSGTVHENIAYASDATREQVIAVARAAAADDFIRALPDGYDTDLGPQGAALSGGQRQRIGIARTLLRDPPVLVLDEPTTGLDAVNEAAVLDGLKALMAGRTTILITHSPRLAATADRVVELAGGRLARARDPRPGAAARAAARPGRDARARSPARSARGRRLGDVEVGRVVYKPGDTLAVHYRAVVDGEPRDAVATRIAGVDLAARIGKRSYADLARKARPRSAAPPHADAELGVLVTWLPFDPKLPALAEPAAELGRRLGIEIPRRARAARLQAAGARGAARERPRAEGLRGAAAVRGGGRRACARRPAGRWRPARTPARCPSCGWSRRRAVGGRRPGSAREAAELAGALAAELQRADVAGLAPAPPERHLAAAARKAALIGAVLPGAARARRARWSSASAASCRARCR